MSPLHPSVCDGLGKVRGVEMVKCQNCHRVSELISEFLGVCGNCIRKDFLPVAPIIKRAHAQSRRAFQLSEKPPHNKKGRKCNLCANECQIPLGERGYCGLRINEELAEKVDARTSCICYFGGDPSPQMAHALSVSVIARSARAGQILRICWETNGSMHLSFLKKALQLSYESGGCIKFDLKAADENLHYALTGASNRRTLENFHWAALVAFYPNFYFYNLPTTSRRHAEECFRVARDAGLKNVHLGNIHLLSNDY